MIRPFEEVNKDWTFFDWDEWENVRRKIGEDKFEEIKDDIYDILESVYGVGFEEGFVDARHCWYKYAHIIRRKCVDFYKKVMKENKHNKDDIFDFVTNIITIDCEDIIMNKDEA